jgi:hypothetical protein
MLVFVVMQLGVHDATRSTLRLCLSPTPSCFKQGVATATSKPKRARQPEHLFARLCITWLSGCARKTHRQDLGDQAPLRDVSKLSGCSVLHLFIDPLGLTSVWWFVLKKTDIHVHVSASCLLRLLTATSRSCAWSIHLRSL